MARSTIGSLWDRGNRNELNRMLEELYSSVFIFNDGTGFITSKHLANGAVGYSELDESIRRLILEFRDDYSGAMTSENEEWVV